MAVDPSGKFSPFVKCVIMFKKMIPASYKAYHQFKMPKLILLSVFLTPFYCLMFQYQF